MQEIEDGPQFVGFYWTFPVKWAGLDRLSSRLPDDPAYVDEAAQRSRTIRYQRELARDYAQESKGRIIKEFAYLERSPDRSSASIRDRLRLACKYCVPQLGGRATLLWADFREQDGWRTHYHLRNFLQSSGMCHEPLAPVPRLIDNQIFVPAQHFSDWRDLNEEKSAERGLEIPQAIAEAMQQFPEQYGRNGRIARHLNDIGLRTRTGLQWSEETVRKEIAAIRKSQNSKS